METVQINECAKGEFIRFAENGPVYIRGDYDRALKKYSVYKFDDISAERFIKGEKIVFVGFTF